MNKIYLTSDLHLGHNKDFVYAARGFENVEEMNEAIIERWNSIVDDEDDIYVLGDLVLGSTQNIDYLNRLKGRIHIVFGNHDTEMRQIIYKELPNVVETAWSIMLKYKKYHFYLTHFPSMTGNIEKESLKQCTLNLFGHTHQKEKFYNDLPYMYHVGVDTHNCYPILLDDIIDEMNIKYREAKEDGT